MMKRVVFCMIAIFLGWNSWSYAERPIQIFLEGALHRASIDGSVQQPDVDLGVLGRVIDLDGTLGLEDVNGLVGKAGILIYGRHEIIADYRHYRLSEDTTLASSIRFGDIDFSANLPVSPSLKFQTVGLFYGFRLINMDSVFLSLRPGVEFVSYEVGMKASLLGFEWDSSTYSGDYTIPFMLIAGEIKLHPIISLTGEFSGGMIDEQSAYLARPALKLNLYPNISAFLGYSQIWFKDDKKKDDDKDNSFEITLSGLVAGVQVIF